MSIPPISRSSPDNASDGFEFRRPVAALTLLRRPYGVRCSPAPTRGAGSSSLTWKTPPAVSTLDPMHHRATNALARVVSAT